MITDTTRTEFDSAFEKGIASNPLLEIEGHPFFINPKTGERNSLESYLKHPLRRTVSRSMETVTSFEEYVNRFKQSESSIYVEGLIICAQIDHSSNIGKLSWGDHTAKVMLRFTEEWEHWAKMHKVRLSQEGFADLLETRAADIVKPESAAMLEIARELHVTNNSAASSYLRSGSNHSLTFTSEKKATSKDGLEIPSRFEIRLRPFINSHSVVTLAVRLKVHISSDHPVFIYELQDLEETIYGAKKSILDGIEKSTELPVYL